MHKKLLHSKRMIKAKDEGRGIELIEKRATRWGGW